VRRRPSIPRRCRFFLGCEGQSEQSYGALLQHLADESPDLHIHLDVQPLYVTTNTTANVYGNFNLNGDVNGFGNYDGSGTATSTTYVPPQFHTQVVPETFIRTEHAIAFLAN
jgi:hypothetical protein